MFMIRFGVLAIIGIMLLPRGPAELGDGRPGATAEQGGFCERYPKTCDASVELGTAFRQKLFYGIALARRSLESQPYAATGSSGQSFGQPFGRTDTDSRQGDWRAGRQNEERHVNNAPGGGGRSGEWRGPAN